MKTLVTYLLACTENYNIADGDRMVRLKRGQHYNVTRARAGMVSVILPGRRVLRAPANLFEPRLYAGTRERRLKNPMRYDAAADKWLLGRAA